MYITSTYMDLTHKPQSSLGLPFENLTHEGLNLYHFSFKLPLHPLIIIHNIIVFIPNPTHALTKKSSKGKLVSIEP